jgi:hypothetical protein
MARVLLGKRGAVTKVLVTFDEPVYDGGHPILDYTVTSSSGNFTATGRRTGLIVNISDSDSSSRRQRQQEFSFHVTARNVLGTSARSQPSNNVIVTVMVMDDTTMPPAAEQSQLMLPQRRGGNIATPQSSSANDIIIISILIICGFAIAAAVYRAHHSSK